MNPLMKAFDDRIRDDLLVCYYGADIRLHTFSEDEARKFCAEHNKEYPLLDMKHTTVAEYGENMYNMGHDEGWDLRDHNDTW